MVSTLITGSPAAIAAVTVWLMCANCRSRSGWLAPSRVLRLPRPPDPTWLQHLATLKIRQPALARLGDLHAGIDEQSFSLEPLLDWAARDERDRLVDPGAPE